MSKEIIKELTASELICYVCLEQIESLAELNDIYKNNLSLYSKYMERLQKSVNYDVVSVKARHEKLQRFRHVNCDPFDAKILTEYDL